MKNGRSPYDIPDDRPKAQKSPFSKFSSMSLEELEKLPFDELSKEERAEAFHQLINIAADTHSAKTKGNWTRYFATLQRAKAACGEETVKKVISGNTN